MKKLIGYFGLSVALCSGAAQAGEEDVVKYRHYLMEAIGGHMNNAVAIIKGEVPYKEQLAFHAESLANAAPYVLPRSKQKR